MRKSVLLLGADKNPGAAVYKVLRESYDVYTYQEMPTNMGQDDPTWFMGDLEQPQETVTLIMKLREKLGDEKLSAVVVSSSFGHRLYEDVSSHDLTRAAVVDVFEPLIMVKYLLRFDLLDWTGRAVFVLSKLVSEVSHFPLKVVGAGMEPMVRAFAGRLPATFQVGCVICKDWQGVGQAVENMLDEHKMSVRVEV